MVLATLQEEVPTVARYLDLDDANSDSGSVRIYFVVFIPARVAQHFIAELVLFVERLALVIVFLQAKLEIEDIVIILVQLIVRSVAPQRLLLIVVVLRAVEILAGHFGRILGLLAEFGILLHQMRIV